MKTQRLVRSLDGRLGRYRTADLERLLLRTIPKAAIPSYLVFDLAFQNHHCYTSGIVAQEDIWGS